MVAVTTTPDSHTSDNEIVRMSRNQTGKKRISSTRDDAVLIEVGPMIWSRLAASIRGALLEGLERVAATRKELSQSARVAFLPPIQIKCELWIHDDRSINGMAPALVRCIDGFCLGAELPAQTCV